MQHTVTIDFTHSDRWYNKHDIAHNIDNKNNIMYAVPMVDIPKTVTVDIMHSESWRNEQSDSWKNTQRYKCSWHSKHSDSLQNTQWQLKWQLTYIICSDSWNNIKLQLTLHIAIATGS